MDKERRSCIVLEVPTKRRLIPGEATKRGGQAVSRVVELSFWLPIWQTQNMVLTKEFVYLIQQIVGYLRVHRQST